MSFSMAMMLVNEHKRQKHQPPFSASAVYSLSKRLKPKVTKVVRKKQGDTDVNSAWAKARYNSVTQLLIRFGLLESQPDENGNLADYFNKDKITALQREQVADWEETHRKCQIGGIGSWVIYERVPSTFPT
jgi:hypothetical protein